MLSRMIIASIRGYQLVISPLLPGACRFYPTCSEYALQSIHRYGPFRGGIRSFSRLLRCHPWHPGGFDPVQ